MAINIVNRSYLKWAGSKNKVLPHLFPILEKYKHPTFIEPFVGAANVSLNFDAEKYILNDLNRDLINSHKIVCMGVKGYIDLCLAYFNKGYDSYYKIREEFNTNHVTKWLDFFNAAQFQYLNKHGFNGLCRYNKKGEFNVPIGTIKKGGNNVPKQQILFFSNRFKKDDFTCLPFDQVIDSHEGLVYCDPPYVPMTESNFDYTGTGFDFQQQVLLKDLAKQSKNVVIISNHWNKLTQDLYKDADETHIIDVQRTISCKGKERVKVQECIVVYR